MQSWLSIKSASGYCDTSVRTIRKWMTDGLRHSRVRGKILIKAEHLDEFLESFAVSEDFVDRVVEDVVQEICSG